MAEQLCGILKLPVSVFPITWLPNMRATTKKKHVFVGWQILLFILVLFVLECVVGDDIPVATCMGREIHPLGQTPSCLAVDCC